MQLLCLDIATTTGWACGTVPDRPLPTPLELRAGDPVYKPQSGSYRIPNAHDASQRLVRYEQWLQDMIAVHKPDVVVFEAPFVTGRTHQNTARLLMYLAGVTELTAKKVQGLRFFEENNARVRKHFINKGSGKRAELKRKTLEACWSLGWMEFSDTDDNRADALALWHYAASLVLARQMQKGAA